MKNHPFAGSQAPAWEPSREAPASRAIGTCEKDLKQSFMGIGSQAGAWEPAEQINNFSVKIERNVSIRDDALNSLLLLCDFVEDVFFGIQI